MPLSRLSPGSPLSVSGTSHFGFSGPASLSLVTLASVLSGHVSTRRRRRRCHSDSRASHIRGCRRVRCHTRSPRCSLVSFDHGAPGERMERCIQVIPPACLHLMIAGPISVALVGYLWAEGDASAVLRSTLAGIPFLALVLFLLLPVIGVPAVGLASIAAGVAESVVLILAVRKRVRVSILSNLLPPAASAIIAALVGWLGASAIGTTLVAALVGAGVALIVYVLLVSVWHRRRLIDTIQLVSRGMRGAVSHGQ